jgi:hypothetical protein
VPNILTITVENPDKILNTGAYGTGAIIRLQTSATEAGAYADVTGTGSTPTIAVDATKRSYDGYDPNGTVSSWYRTRYENAGATRLSDWTPAFQVGDEMAGLLCSVYDVEQELGGTLSANDRETVLEKIRQVSTAIEGYCGRWFAPRPTNPASDKTYRFHSEYGRVLHIPKGVRRITTLGIANTNQPETGGAYTTTTGYYLDPAPWDRDDWPALYVRFAPTVSGRFWNASFGVEITGAFGWDHVPYDIQGVATRAVVRRTLGKGSGGASIPVGPEGTLFLLPDMSGADRLTLDRYRRITV